MSKKHFNALALALASRRPEVGDDHYAARFTQWALDVREVACVCQAQNPLFDYARFIEACGTWNPVIRDGKLVKAA